MESPDCGLRPGLLSELLMEARHLASRNLRLLIQNKIALQSSKT